jgi:hypothetical protein
MIGKVVKPCKTEVVDFISNRIKMTQTTCFLGKTMNIMVFSICCPCYAGRSSDTNQ